MPGRRPNRCSESRLCDKLCEIVESSFATVTWSLCCARTKPTFPDRPRRQPFPRLLSEMRPLARAIQTTTTRPWPPRWHVMNNCVTRARGGSRHHRHHHGHHASPLFKHGMSYWSFARALQHGAGKVRQAARAISDAWRCNFLSNWTSRREWMKIALWGWGCRLEMIFMVEVRRRWQGVASVEGQLERLVLELGHIHPRVEKVEATVLPGRRHGHVACGAPHISNSNQPPEVRLLRWSHRLRSTAAPRRLCSPRRQQRT